MGIMEYGLFSDEGLIEGGFYSLQTAEKALSESDPDDGLEVLEICPDHEEQPAHCCEFCMRDDDDEEEDD